MSTPDPSKMDSNLTPPAPDSQLESSASLLETIVHSLEDAIITKTLDGTITSWNPSATRIFGYQAEEMTGQPILRLIPEYLHEEEREILRKLRAGETIAHYETVRLTKEGKEIPVSLTISPVRNKQGQVVSISKISRDITKHRQLDQVRFSLAAIVESSDDAIISKNLDGTITSWNSAAERIFGYTAEEIVGKSILTLVPEELHSEEQTILETLRGGNRVEHFETFRLRKDGTRINVSLTTSPVKDAHGKIVGASKVLRDISERKRMEQSLLQAEKLAASGKMAATIAHEINNPLEAVLNLIYLARSNSSDPKQVNAFLNAAEGELVRLSHITKQTLGFYRENLSPVYIPLSDLLSDAVKIYAPKLNSAGIEIKTKLASTEKLVMRKGEIIQVISNLIANASYAMPHGGLLMSCVEDHLIDEKAGLLLTVEDILV